MRLRDCLNCDLRGFVGMGCDLLCNDVGREDGAIWGWGCLKLDSGIGCVFNGNVLPLLRRCSLLTFEVKVDWLNVNERSHSAR